MGDDWRTNCEELGNGWCGVESRQIHSCYRSSRHIEISFWLAVVQGIVWSTNLRPIETPMWSAIEITLLILAVAWDALSLVLNLRRNAKGHGASGVPVISWLVYLFLVEWRKQTFFFASEWQAGLALTVFHLLCHFGIPGLQRLFIGKKP